MADEKPWWWPTEINDEWFATLRADYSDKADWSDGDLLDYFGEGWTEFTDTWDHLGDARAEYEKLARAFLDLVEETGKTPSDFLST